jgi:outer membrane protein TolC
MRRLLGGSALLLSFAAGCQGRLPYIDQTKAVPRDPLGAIAHEDEKVKQANFLSSEPDPTSIPPIAPPRTTENPEALEIWPLTLQEAIRIGMDNAETIRVIALGAQGIPVNGFEPTPLNTGAGGGQALGSGTLFTVYDPAIQEAQIQQALSVFDAQFQTSLLWGRNVTPVNNGIQAGSLNSGQRVPAIFDQKTSQFNVQLTKKAATGTLFQLSQQITNTYTNNAFNAFPSAYTSNFTFQFMHPLLGGDQQTGPSGLQANRAPIVIARLQADSTVWQFKQQVLALVRSVEQQYWALAQQHVQLWSREFAVQLAEEILRREQVEQQYGKSTVADVAEAEQQLENFRLQYIQATQDIIVTERQLRNLLGLPPSDGKRIIPASAPTEARVEPDWDTAVAQTIAYAPDIVIQQMAVRIAELNLVVARNQLLPRLDLTAQYGWNGLGRHLDGALSTQTNGLLQAIDPRISNLQQNAGLNVTPGQYRNFENWQVGLAFSAPIGFRGPLANNKAAQNALLRQRAFLQQTTHQTLHSVSRYFQEIDANYKLFKTAQRAREAAAQRLDVQRARYEVGQILIDRYLDAVAQWANAVAEEARYKTQYNTSIIALEEAKGTLLAYNNIAVMEGPSPNKAYIQARDQQNGHVQFPARGGAPTNLRSGRTGPYVADPVTPAVPPDANPNPYRPAMPAPVGPLGPSPTPIAPAVPTNTFGEQTQASATTPPPLFSGGLDLGARTASATPADEPMELPALPPER